jgi:isocitrate dehydrogenase kinase/phosphatase
MSTPSRRATDRLVASDDGGSAAAIAAAIRNGFDRHYALFRYNSQQAKARYEAGDWHAIRRLAR